MENPEKLKKRENFQDNNTPEKSKTKPSKEVIQSPEGKEIEKEAKDSLDRLKKDIEEGRMSFELVKAYLESLDKVSDKDYKAFILGGILSGLNQRGISIEGVKDGKISLKPGIQSLRKKLDIASHEETVSYQRLINNYLISGKISIIELNKALMYRTSSLDNFLNESVDGQRVTTSEYAGRLIEKYALNFKKHGVEIDLNNLGITIKKEQFKNEATFLAFRESIKRSITDNQADREFLLAFFDDIYYNDRRGIKEDAIEDYKKSSKKIEAGFFDGLNRLSEDQKYALGIKSEDDAKEIIRKWKNNPLEAAKEAFANGGGLLGVILGIVGAIFWGKKGFLGGFVSGLALAGGGSDIALKMINEGLDGLDRKIKRGKGGQESLSKTPPKTTSLFDKFKGRLEANFGNLNKEELLKKWEELSKNDKFLAAPASLLEIFRTEKNETKILEELKKYGIELTKENAEFYKHIFDQLIKERNESIGNYKTNEQVGDYLNRKNRVDTGPIIPHPPKAIKDKHQLKGIKLAPNQRLDEDGNILTGEFEIKNGVEYLKNGERRNRDNTKIEVFKDGALIYTYEGGFKDGKFSGIVKYNDGTGRVDVFEDGKIKDYTLEYIGGLMGLLGITLTPSLFGPVGVATSGVLGVGYSVADLFNQGEDLMRDILKSIGVVDKRFEGGKKTFWDNTITALGIIPGVTQVRLIAKIKKVTSKLPPSKWEKLNQISRKVSEELAEKVGTLKSKKRIDKEILKILGTFEEGRSIKIGDVEFKKLKNGRFRGKINGVEKEFDENQLLKFINSFSPGIKQEFVASAKRAMILEKHVGKIVKIDGYEVEILRGGKWKVRAKNGTILDEQETAEFVSKNIDKLAENLGLSITEGGSRVKKGIIAGYERCGIKTFWDYLEKAGYVHGKKSRFSGGNFREKLDFLGGIILTPATTIRQLFSAIPNKEWENLFRILISGNKNMKVLGEGGIFSRLWNSGLTNALITYGLVDADNIIDSDTSTLDEIGDAAFYRFGGILNTIAAKFLGIID